MASIIADTTRSDCSSISIADEHPPDPYEIAYLRGGADELLKLRLFELQQHGHLVVLEEKRWYGLKHWLVAAPDAPGALALSPLQLSLRALYRYPLSPKEILKLEYPPELVADCRRYRQSLQQRGWLSGWFGKEDPAYDHVQFGSWILVGLCLILNFALGPKFNLIFAIIVLSILRGIAFHLLSYRANRAGRQYLNLLEGQFADCRKFDVKTWAEMSPATRLAAVAVLGYGILQNTPADAIAAVLSGANSNVEVEVGSGCGGCGGCGG
jgi:uncharacterized protein (TIGR04222 family)